MKRKITTLVFAMLIFIVAMAAVACKSNVSIEINSKDKPRDVYVLGQDLDLSVGSIVVKEGDNEYTENLASPEVSVSGYEKDRLGAKELTVSYRGATTSYFVNVYEAIEVTGALLDYFVGEPFDYSKGEATVTDRKEGWRKTLKLDEVDMIGFDSSTVGTRELTIRNGEDVKKLNYTIWEMDGNASEFHAPEKTTYKSHETEIDLVGGYILAKNATGEIKKEVTLTKDMISGFKPSLATEENTASNPLKQTVSVTFAGKTWPFEIKVEYTEVTKYQAIAQKYMARNYNYLDYNKETEEYPNDLTEAEQAEVFAAMDLLMGFSEDERSFISNEEKLAIAVPACLYGWSNYISVFGDFIPVEDPNEQKAFSYRRMSVGPNTYMIVISFSAPTYSIAKNAYDTLIDTDSDDIKSMLKYNKVVVDAVSDAELGNLMLPQKVLTYLGRPQPTSLKYCFENLYYVVNLQELLYDGTETNPGVLSVVKHMLDFYDSFDGIDLSTMKQPEIQARLDDLYEDLVSSPAGGDYNLIAQWTQADDQLVKKDIVFILFKHLYDKAEAEGFDKTKDSYKDWVLLGDFVLPAIYEELYTSALSTWNYGYDYVKDYMDRYGAMYEYYSTNFQNNLHITKKQLKNFETLEEPYQTVYLKSFDVYKIKFFGLEDESRNYYTINEFMDAVYALNVSYFGSMFKNAELEEINELYAEMIGMALGDTYGSVTKDESGHEIVVLTEEFKKVSHDFFKKFIEAPASVQYNFLLSYSNEDKLLLQFISAQDNDDYQNTVMGNVIAIYFYSEVMKDISEEKDENDKTIPSDKELAIDVFNLYLKAIESFDRRELRGSSYGLDDFISSRSAANALLVQTPQNVQDLFANNDLLKALTDKVDEYFALTENGKLKDFAAVIAQNDTYKDAYSNLTGAMTTATIVLEWAGANRAYGAYFAAYERVAKMYNELLAQATKGDDLYNALNYGKVTVTSATSGQLQVVPAIYMADLYSDLIDMMSVSGFYVSYNGDVENCYDVYFDDEKVRDYVLEAADLIVNYVISVEVSVIPDLEFIKNKNLKASVDTFMAKFYGTASDGAMTANDRVLFLSLFKNNTFANALFFYYADDLNLDFTKLNSATLREAHAVSKFLDLMVIYYPYKYWSEQDDITTEELNGFKTSYDEALAEFNAAYDEWSDITEKATFDQKLGTLVNEFKSMPQNA